MFEARRAAVADLSQAGGEGASLRVFLPPAKSAKLPAGASGPAGWA